jgi:hypothetical protein
MRVSIARHLLDGLAVPEPTRRRGSRGDAGSLIQASAGSVERKEMDGVTGMGAERRLALRGELRARDGA